MLLCLLPARHAVRLTLRDALLALVGLMLRAVDIAFRATP